MAIPKGFKSRMTPIDITSESNIYLLIQDYMIMDFIFKFVTIFGVGYFITANIFKR